MTVGILTQPIDTNRRLDAVGVDGIGATTGDVWGASFEDAWTRNPGVSAWRWAGRAMADGGRTLDAEEANRDYGVDGHLRFDGPVPELRARELADLKRAELARQDTLRRAGGGVANTLTGLGAGLAASLLDPVNIAASFVPVVGPARYAGMLARAGSLAGRTAVRAGVGAAAGAVGAALVEPLVYGVARDEQADYSAVDSLLNLTFGGLMGGGLHAVGGAVADAVRPGRWRAPLAERLDALPLEAREGATRAAVAAVAEDRPVEGLDGLLAAERPGAGGRPAPAPHGMGRRAGPGNLGSVFDSDGRRLDVRYEVTDLARLVTSNRDDLSPNPDYPQHLQPRNRERAASEEQIRDIVARFEPSLLTRSPDASTGAPVVGPDHVVESGNGRSLTLRRIYAGRPDLAAKYQAELVHQGFDVRGHARPVLIARRLTPLDDGERRAFTVAAQKARTLELSASERALADAGRLDGSLRHYQGGDPNSAGNATMRRAFIAALPQTEQGMLLDAGGGFSMDGQRRFRNALLARAFDDADLLGRMLEAGDDSSKTLSNALLDIAPAWARLRSAAAAGEIAPGADATADLLSAVRAIRDARAAGRPLSQILAQADAFDPRSPAEEMFLAGMLRLDRTASREAIGAMLSRYVDEAMKSRPGPDLFGTAPPTGADILTALRRNDPAAPPPDDLDAAARIEALARDPAKPAAAELDGAMAALDADLQRHREAGRLRGDEPEFAEAAAHDARGAAEESETRAAAFCLSRRA